MGMQLQEWANNNMPFGRMNHQNAFWEQVSFVRDRIPEIILRGHKTSRDLYNAMEKLQEIEAAIKVVSTHISESILLPVYKVELEDGTTFVMRDNFRDWKVSVSSPYELEVDFMGLFDPNEEIPSHNCEGFPEEWIFGSYVENKQRFTCELPSSNFYLFVFFWLFIFQTFPTYQSTIII